MTRTVLKGIQTPPGTDVEVDLASISAPFSFVRAFGPDESTPLPADQWTAIVLDPAGEPWRQIGEVCWEPILSGDPDYALSSAGVRCLIEGIYDFGGAAIFNPAQPTGSRGIRIFGIKGSHAGDLGLIAGIPAPKNILIPVTVSGNAYADVGDIIELQLWTDTATATMSDPKSEWLSANLVGRP